MEAQATKQVITDLAGLVGHTIDDRYELARVLGRGGMGVVFEGVQRSMGRRVAVKMLQLGGVLEGESLQRFEREIGIIAGLRHPNIVNVLDSGRDAKLGLFFIVMELIEGEPLSRLLASPPATAHPAMALEIIYQVCAALTEPHAQGIIHRDIKPDNVLLMAMSDESAQVKVVDFGVARAWEAGAEKLTGTGIALGTPSYMAPELCEAGQIDARTDLYAVGVMMYELLAGRPPFEGGGALALMLKHLQEPVPPLPASHPALERWPEVEALARRLMAKNPADRPQTAREVLRRIEAIRAAHGIGQVRIDPELPVAEALRAYFAPLPEPSGASAAIVAAPGSAPVAPTTPGATAHITSGAQAALAAQAAARPLKPTPTITAEVAATHAAQAQHAPRHGATQLLPTSAPMPDDGIDDHKPRRWRGALIAGVALLSALGCGAASLGGWMWSRAPEAATGAAARPAAPVVAPVVAPAVMVPAAAPLPSAKELIKQAEEDKKREEEARREREEREAEEREREREEVKKPAKKPAPKKSVKRPAKKPKKSTKRRRR